MGKKRASLAAGAVSGSVKNSKKGKKRRRESAPGGAASSSLAKSSSGGPEKRRSHSSSSSSKEVVLRCAPKGAVSPIVVSFANQTVPNDMSTLKFAVHQGEDEARLGQRVIMGEGPRYASMSVLLRVPLLLCAGCLLAVCTAAVKRCSAVLECCGCRKQGEDGDPRRR